MTTSLRFSTLAVLFVAVLMPCHGAGAQTPDGVSQTPVETLNPLSAIDPASLSGFRDRPLFAPSRQRPQDVAAPEAETALATADPVELRLLGIVSTPEGAIARILDLADNSGHSLRKGEQFQDWTLVSIGASEVTLRKDDATQTLSIFKQSALPAFADTGAQSSPDTAPSDTSETAEPPRDVRIIPMSK